MGNRARAKGSQGEAEVAALLLKKCEEKYPGKFTARDFRTVAGGANGEDVKLSSAAYKVLPVAVEVKFKKLITNCKWMAQAESHVSKVEEGTIPVCIFRQNHGKYYATLDAELLIDLLLEKYNERT